MVHGTGVNVTRSGEASNIKYRNVEFSRDSLGLSTQLVTLKPRSLYWYRYACMDCDDWSMSSTLSDTGAT